VPDLLSRIGPILKSLVPGRSADERVTELKPWARAVVTLYVLTIVPLLVVFFGLMIVSAPRVVGTAWHSLGTHAGRLGDDGLARGALDVVQMLVLTLPALGIVYTFTRVGWKAGRGSWVASEGRPVLRAGTVVAGAAILAGLAALWWPRGDYRPIQPGERGTVSGAITQVRSVTRGLRPATPAPAAKPKPAEHARTSTTETTTRTTRTTTTAETTSTASAATTAEATTAATETTPSAVTDTTQTTDTTTDTTTSTTP
jgi:putative peptide zinc metalloprotease protein